MRSETLLVNGSPLILTRRPAGSTCQSVFARFPSRCEHHTALKWFAAIFTSCRLSPGGRAAFKLFKHLDLWCLSPSPSGHWSVHKFGNRKDQFGWMKITPLLSALPLGDRAAFKLFKQFDLWCLLPLPPGIGVYTT